MLLGIDIGTTNIKAGLYAVDGKRIAHLQTTNPLANDNAGRTQYIPDQIWRKTCELVCRIAAAHDVTAIAVASMGEAGVPLDAQGTPTYPIIPWNDHRAENQMDQLAEQLSDHEWYAITGLQPNPIHSIAKWMWLREMEPQVWQRTRKWLSVSDYFSWRMTGEMRMSSTQAARTMAFDVIRNEWSRKILARAGIDVDILPGIATGTDIAGKVTQAAADITGLRKGTPVFIGGHDQIIAALAAGALNADVVLDSLGTAEGLTIGVDDNWPVGKTGGFGFGPHVVAGHNYLLGGIYSSGGSLAWVKSLFGIESYDRLFELASRVEPGSAPLFKAHFYGEAPPFPDRGARAGFIDVIPDHEPAHLMRAVLEGIAFELKRHLDAFEAMSGRRANIIRCVGGAARNDLWPRIRAAILDRTIELSTNEDMVTQGAALIAGIGAGIYESPAQAVAATLSPGKIVEPNAAWRERYLAPYRRYCEISESLSQKRRI